MVTLTPLAVQNAALLRLIDQADAAITQTPTVAELAASADRDVENVRKSLKTLAAAGLLAKDDDIAGSGYFLTAEGLEIREALDRAEGLSPQPEATVPGVETMIHHQLIVPDGLNPRKSFDDEALNELAASILADGQLQNLVVRPAEPMENYGQPVHRLVAGERRWRAFGRLIQQGKLPADTKVRCLVIAIDDKAHARLALIENLQRRDLSPLDEARGFQRLIDDYGYTTDSIAEDVKFTQRFVQQRLQLMQLTTEDQEKLEKGEITIEEARRRVADRNRMTLSLPPARLMLLAEITAHIERNGKAVSYWGKAVEMADGGTSEDLEALAKAGLISVHRRDRETARSFITLTWQTKDKLEVTLPDFKGGTRPACLRRLRTEVLGAEATAALEKAKTWSADFLNGPFEIAADAQAEIAKREADRLEQERVASERRQFAEQAEAAKRAAVDAVQACAAEWVLNPVIGDFEQIAKELGHPLPYWQDPGSHRTYDANGAEFSLFEYYGWNGREHMRRLMVIGLNAAAGFATPLEKPQRAEVEAEAGGDIDQLEAHEEGVCDAGTCPHCESEEAADLEAAE